MTLNENQTRKLHIDGQLSKAGWNLLDSAQVKSEVPASGVDDDWFDGITDYSLYLPNGEIIAVVEAKRQSRSPQTAREQAKLYAVAIEKNQSFRPFVFLANGNECWFWDTETETPREVAAFFTRSRPIQKEIDQLGNQFWVTKEEVTANKYDLSASRYRRIEPDETFYEEPDVTLERLLKLEEITKEETENLLRTVNSLGYNQAEAN